MFFDYSSSYTGINILTYSDMYSLMISVNGMATLTFSIIMIAIPFQHATIVFLCPLSHIVSLFVQKSRLRNSGTTVFIVFILLYHSCYWVLNIYFHFSPPFDNKSSVYAHLLIFTSLTNSFQLYDVILPLLKHVGTKAICTLNNEQ